MMKASDYIIDFFASRGVECIFGYIGGMITHLVDSASKNPNVKFIQTYHEQNAAFAAEGCARVSGLPGVAMATSGPGAVNMLTGVANAYFDSVPVIYLTGQVNSFEYKYDKPIRQQGFQETDVVSMARPITKYAVMIDAPENLRYELEKAWHIATSGRQGPVLLDLPMNIQRAEIDPEKARTFQPEEPEDDPLELLEEYLAQFAAAKRPLLLIGGGCRNAGLGTMLETLIRAGLPAVSSLQGKGVVREDLPGFIGMLGSYGNRAANLCIARADAILVLGSRLDSRQTGNLRESFSGGKRIFHLDVDAAELQYSRVENRSCWRGNLSHVETLLAQCAERVNCSQLWRQEIADLKAHYSLSAELERFIENKLPYQYLEKLSRLAPSGSTYCVDIGQNQMWAAQTLVLKEGQEFFTSGGMAPMGYAIPAAVGVAMAERGKKQVFAICGDGGFQIAMQTLLLISQYRLPVTILLMNNNALGMITQFQTLYFKRNYAATTETGGYRTPDFQKLAEAFSLPYRRITDPAQLTAEMLIPGIVELVIPGLTTVSPKLEFDQPISNMTPFLPPEELKSLLTKRGNGE